ncbi:hypothetical protein SAMN06296378_2033 [Salinibacterium xinjiangense]|uniref:Uncharacterized protein n=1 Tax=Salinibacterium xinjiangense TaxID=386302 RepID=A0A2C8ZVB8_9MICO|nr:hypothetical protein SAMN06296378_2033 [Salinibacterium xinjiangense]
MRQVKLKSLMSSQEDKLLRQNHLNDLNDLNDLNNLHSMVGRPTA